MLNFTDIDEFFVNRLILTSFNPELDLIYKRLSKSQILLIKENMYHLLMGFDSMLVLHYSYRRRRIVVLFNRKDIREDENKSSIIEKAFNIDKTILNELGIDKIYLSEFYPKLQNINQLKSAKDKFKAYDIEKTNVYAILNCADSNKSGGYNQTNDHITIQRFNNRCKISDRTVIVKNPITVIQDTKENTFEMKPDSDVKDTDESIYLIHLSIFKKSISISSNFSTGKDMSVKIAEIVVSHLNIYSENFVDKSIDNRIDIIHNGVINKSKILNKLFVNDGFVIKCIIADIQEIFEIKKKIILSVNSSESNITHEEEENNDY